MDFSQVEAEFQRLKAQFEAGALTEEDFKAQLEELMIQDEEGRWWMIGYETGQWYYHDGEKWVQGEPPPVAERRREQVRALCQEGAAALAAGDWGAAVERFEAALALEPGHAKATEGLAKARAAEAPKPGEPEAPPAVRWVWVVAGVIGLILLVILIQSGILSGFGPPSEVAFWADPDVIAPGECTGIHWSVVGVEHVYLYGPPDYELQWAPAEGAEEVCPEESATYELKNPEKEVIATVIVEVR